MEAYETDASLAQLPKEAAYPELVLRCTVMDAVPLRACEFSDGKVFTVIGSVAPSSPADVDAASQTLTRINFYDAWAAAAAFMDPGDVILLRGFAVIDVPVNVGGHDAANAGASLSSQSPAVRAPLMVRPLQVESTLRVLQKGEKNTVMEVSVSPENWDAVGVRSLPSSDAANQRYARMCWGWGKGSGTMPSSGLKYKSVDDFIAKCITARDPNQPEFTQAVREVMTSLWPFLQQNPKYTQDGLLERLVEPERLIQFRVPWVDDKGVTHVNRAFRVQFSSAIGPYKGGMRFHPSVNLSILKFLGFEQTFKNSLTTLPMGGGKGGSDFDPKGKSDHEVMRFCQSLVAELYRHIGANTDVPAGDIGVGGREVGYMNGMYWKLTNTNECTFTGKGLAYQGSEIRPEATGYGLVYFALSMLERIGDSFEGKTVLVSGAGNVAQYAIEKCMQLGAKVVTASDSLGYIYDKDGFDKEKLAKLMELKNERRGTLEQYAKETGVEYVAGQRPWGVKADIALPCATQNEVEPADAKQLVANGVKLVAEGANMPTTEEATEVLHKAGVLFAPGKASNAGGVAISGLEMSQNAARLAWTAEDVDNRLRGIMTSIHESCVKYGEHDGKVNYVDGANIAGFVKVADAMLALGVV